MSILLGQGVDAIDTPALVIDLDAMQRNLEAMASFVHERGLRLRPHAKTHKSAWLAQQQIALGAVGACIQKTSEAEALAAKGVRDLFITNEVIDEGKLARVATLAREVKMSIAVDSALGVERLVAALQGAGSMVDVFVEIDVGQGRCGTPPGEAAALARSVIEHGLPFAGLQAYHGRAQHLRSVAERRAAISASAQAVRDALAALKAAGIACPLVSGAAAVASCSKPTAACGASCNAAPTCSWTATMPTTTRCPARRCDPTVNLHDAMIGVRGGLARGVVERVIAVDARGCIT